MTVHLFTSYLQRGRKIDIIKEIDHIFVQIIYDTCTCIQLSYHVIIEIDHIFVQIIYDTCIQIVL